MQNAKLNLTPIVLHSMLQIRENYFGWSYYPVTSEEIRYWGGRNLRSRYAGRDWIVDKQTKKRVRARSNNSDAINDGTNNNGNNVNINNTMQNSMKDNEDVDNVIITKLKVANVNAYQYTFSINLKNNEVEVPVSLINENDIGDGISTGNKNGNMSPNNFSSNLNGYNMSEGNGQNNNISNSAKTNNNVLTISVDDVQFLLNTRGEQHAPMYTDMTFTLSPLKVMSYNDFIHNKAITSSVQLT